MKNQIITRILTHAALLCLPFVSIKAVDWAPVPNPVATLTSNALAQSLSAPTHEDITNPVIGSTINFDVMNDLMPCEIADDGTPIDRATKGSKKPKVSKVADPGVNDWVPVGTTVATVNDDIWADGLAYAHGDMVSPDIATINPAQTYNTSFSATAAIPTLNIYGTLYTDAPGAGGTQVLDGGSAIPCPLKIDGNVRIDAIGYSAIINIKEDVVIEPYLASPAGDYESGYSQIYFNAALGKTITVNVDYNVTFQGKTTDVTYQDLIITFNGQGRTIFKMVDGTTIQFTGQVDTTGGITIDPNTGLLTNWEDFPSNAGGTKVFVTMDQTKAQVDAGTNKLTFERKTYTSQDLRTLVYVGPNSTFTYLSDNFSGQVDSEGIFLPGGYASVAFDPSNPGTGRMVLFIRGAYAFDTDPYLLTEGEEIQPDNPNFLKLTHKYPFNDGAVVVAGHYVIDFEPESISGGGGAQEGGVINPLYDFSTPAGIQAILRVTDGKAFTARTADPYNPTIDNRRGLLIVNDCDNHGKLSSDPYWDLYGDPVTTVGTYFAYANPANALRNVRKGFVVGVNGMIDVYHNCFVDYTAGAVNQQDPIAEWDYADLSLIKKRNPSALILDGIDAALYVDGNPLLVDEYGDPTLSLFEAANPFTQANPSQATINLRGDAALYLKESASSKDHIGYMYNFWARYAETDPTAVATDDPAMDPELDWNTALSVASDCTYDGFSLSGNEHTNVSGEGQHVLDAEGPGAVISVSNALTGRTYASTVTKSGIVNMATILLDYTGREIFADETPVERPLMIGDDYFYTRYNSPALFLNNFIHMYDSILRHSDATKYVDGIPNFSEPAITGGERLYFSQMYWGVNDALLTADPDRYRFPELRFFNSTLELQESLNVSGIRSVVMDIPGLSDNSGDNRSVVTFFDHGDELDTALTGFGRIFMFGSSLNLMADDLDVTITGSGPKTASSNFVTESAYLNVFKHNQLATQVDLSSTSTLSLQNGNQFPASVAPSSYDLQRAQHLLMFSIPNAVGASTNMRIGWPTTQGDASAFPGSYPYSDEILTTEETDLFTLDALTVPPAMVSINGKYIVFGSFDKNGNGSRVPVATADDSGIIYTDHGGKITIARPASTSRATQGISYQALFATTLAARIWNDYDYAGTTRELRLTGIIDLPQDQVTFDPTFSIQPYGFTQEMFDARREETDGYVRVSFENPDRDPRRADKCGAEEVTFGWHFRDFDAQNYTPIKNVMRNFRHRWVESIDTPVTRPTDLLYIGAGDDIKQIRVAGATMSDPFQLDVSGDGTRPIGARVREFTSVRSTIDPTVDHFIGEGAHAALFVEYDGRIGLGSRSWNKHSVNAWNILGKDFITICPLGSGFIDVNANLLVADRQALVASDQFGVDQAHRLTFYSDQVREIRIPANGELDLSSFGKGTDIQQIAFAGKIKLIFEEGATLRLPDTPTLIDGKPSLILYFNDQSELIFEGAGDPSNFIPFETSGDTQYSRIKIVGKGQIWLNKEATLSVMGNTMVAVQSDDLTPNTDVTISMQRDSSFQIGNDNLAGGSFEVGNPLSSQRPSTDTIAFALRMNGPSTTFHLDRLGFFGLGAGVINKYDKPNGEAAQILDAHNIATPNPELDVLGNVVATLGLPTFNPDTTEAWQIQPLDNVTTVTLEITQGIFESKNIADGSSNLASLMAVGPATRYTIAINDRAAAFVRGGGNIMYVPAISLALGASNIYYANIWDYAGVQSTGEAYSILASAPLMIDRTTADFTVGSGTVSPFLILGKQFVGNHYNAYQFLSFNPLNLQTRKKADIGGTQFGTRAGYLNQASTKYPIATFPSGAEIVRFDNPTLVLGSNPAQALATGALNVALPLVGPEMNQPANFSPVY